ncbi:MAG: hypothetical protein FP814_16245 [Desulfobacterium sp.]|nr:hypothetical protein [Desulfobacterium sp.]MBU3949725.1 hypothetical protein [Pseudomonadota bacterium]MBU4010879.1 hypothetical protein [Pseudomonadota bacterium]MBU4036965.1 hypothetical protein [Pseudomonadota bacterium]
MNPSNPPSVFNGGTRHEPAKPAKQRHDLEAMAKKGVLEWRGETRGTFYVKAKEIASIMT